MIRNIWNTLLRWKEHPLRMPLILRGARQVGKTFIVEAFGSELFESFCSINFEEAPKIAACFETMEPKEILRSLELVAKQKIAPGKTLLFLDEIQQCPKALQSLRYFKEKCPELHLIAAGSLLEFAMQEEKFSFPVGRVQFARLYPLSFGEFLDALGEGMLRKEMAIFTVANPPPEAVHQHLLSRLDEYFMIGGMPASVDAYLKTRSFLEVRYVQKAIWDTYESDFGKYAPKTSHRHLRKIFSEVPRLIGEHVKYSRIDPEIPNPAREMKQAIELLKLAGLLHPIMATSAGALPLLSGLKETVFKLLFLDVGMIAQAVGLERTSSGSMTGPFAEQFVGQEFLANEDPLLETPLFFWTRERGAAEVDYLIARKGSVIPIEVKAGKWGRLKSIQQFLEEKEAPFGIKLSTEPLRKKGQLLSAPLYMTEQLLRLIDSEKGM